MRLRSRALLVAALIAAAPTPARALPPASLTLTQVGTFAEPVALAVRAGDSRIFIAEKTGRVRTLAGTTILDVSAEVSNGIEQGLLGLAFSPAGTALYVSFTDREGTGRLHIVSYLMSGQSVSLASRRELLVVERPYAKHYSGGLAFGPDGYLYISSGDGGNHLNGQRLNTLLGKMLRIDPRPSSTVPPYYEVPGTNPFVSTPGARPEIWAYGLRNPWRFSFDRATGDLWIGDVGENMWEEINRYRYGGANYGWSLMEGNLPFGAQAPPLNHHSPVYQYSHQLSTPLGVTPIGCAVTGGYVYRGSRIPALQGTYVYGDYCLARVWGLLDLGAAMFTVDFAAQTSFIVSFGEDASGELYVLSQEGPVYRLDP